MIRYKEELMINKMHAKELHLNTSKTVEAIIFRSNSNTASYIDKHKSSKSGHAQR